MDKLLEAAYAEMAGLIARRQGELDLAHARQRDGAAQDMRMVGAFIASSLFSSDDPERFAGLNTGIRVPTTVDHPGNPVSK